MTDPFRMIFGNSGAFAEALLMPRLRWDFVGISSESRKTLVNNGRGGEIRI